jgi:hypothetical protein
MPLSIRSSNAQLNNALVHKFLTRALEPWIEAVGSCRSFREGHLPLLRVCRSLNTHLRRTASSRIGQLYEDLVIWRCERFYFLGPSPFEDIFYIPAFCIASSHSTGCRRPPTPCPFSHSLISHVYWVQPVGVSVIRPSDRYRDHPCGRIRLRYFSFA